jgi:hypothetical protein
LEVGIVTTRCLQTTAVAAEFADNVRSLLQFGAEVQEYGWVHGIAVAVKEVILYHQQQQNHNASAVGSRTMTNVAAVHPPAKYANAAVGAFRNSQRLRRNLKILTQDEDVSKLGAPLVSALSVITGYGWLWGIEKADSSKKTSESSHDVIPVAENVEQSGSIDKEPPPLPLVQTVKETEITASDLYTSTVVALTTTTAVSAAMAKKYNIRIPNDSTNHTDIHVTSDQSPPAGDDEIVLPSLSSPIPAEPTCLPKNIDDPPTASSNSVQDKKNAAVSVATNTCLTAAVAASAAEMDGFHRTNDNNGKTENNVPSNHIPAREDSALPSPPLPSKTDETRAPHDKSKANDAVPAEPNANKEKVDEESPAVSPNAVEDVKTSTASVDPTKSADDGAGSTDTDNNDPSVKAADLRVDAAKVMELIAVCDEHCILDKVSRSTLCDS